jgi:hypothetical protein
MNPNKKFNCYSAFKAVRKEELEKKAEEESSSESESDSEEEKEENAAEDGAPEEEKKDTKPAKPKKKLTIDQKIRAEWKAMSKAERDKYKVVATKKNLDIRGEDDVGITDFYVGLKKEKEERPEDFVEEYLARPKKRNAKRKTQTPYKQFCIN